MSNNFSNEIIDLGYKPDDKILKNYAKVLVNFALNGGKGIKEGDVVHLLSPLSGLPLYRSVREQVIDSGGLVIDALRDDIGDSDRYFYEHASNEQLTTFMDKYFRGLVDQMDHLIAITADHNPQKLKDIDPKKLMQSRITNKQFTDWWQEKEHKGEFSWTIGLYGTPAMAKEAGLTEHEYWEQIEKACYLDSDDPVLEWKRIDKEVSLFAEKLTNLQIDKVHVQGNDADLHITIGENRKWVSGGGCNIPSFEVFTSPDRRGTEGWMRFNQPLYAYSNKVDGIELSFEKGRVVNSSATENESMLRELLAADEGASYVGEFSLTDKRLSRITKFMARTLFDENMGGEFGNTHIAIGRSYEDTFNGDVTKLSEEELEKLGFNDSSIHTDIISTTDRVVTATLKDGSEQVIYKNGQFTV